MAVLARALKADADVVALTQTLRVALIVLTVPPLVLLFGSDGGLISGGAQAATPPPAALVALFGAGAIVSLAASRVPSFPAPWLFGPMMVGAAAAFTGWQTGELPRAALVAAQLLIGMVLGCRFSREALTRLPRATAAGVAAGGREEAAERASAAHCTPAAAQPASVRV
jgi:uncharacterized membrane protein AbrB (regulator of aidB expression)